MSMMNRYPLWKNLLVILIAVCGLVLALPNLYGEDPAVQVSASNAKVDQDTVQKVDDALKAAKLGYKTTEVADDRVLVRFADTDTQLHALDVLKQSLGTTYNVALNLAPRTPKWMSDIGLKPMSKGLDLQGGVHFQLLVDLNAAAQTKLQRDMNDIRGAFREKLIRYEDISLNGNFISLQLRTPDDVKNAKDLLTAKYPDLTLTDGTQPNSLNAGMTDKDIQALRQSAVEQNITTLRNRVNELGVAEPIVQQQGASSIVVELPGVQDTARAKEILGATASLEFRLVDPTGDVFQAQQTGHVPLDDQLFTRKDNGQPVLLRRDVIVSGEQLVNAVSGFDQQTGTPDVSVTLDSAGASKMGDTTRENLGKPMAVLYIETKAETTQVNGQPVTTHKKEYSVINVATIQGIFSSRFQITGLGQDEANNLGLLLRAGSLAAPMDIIEERTVGPSLGQENIRQGFYAALLGFVLVVVFMALYYKVFGLIADLAVFMNLVLTVALLGLIQATLTLPGIAGIVLTLGMGVDANVLINERVREEVRNGNSPQASIDAGYRHAFATIVDAHVTTLIAALMLLLFGSGPVKGFAVTLTLGIITSLFTAIMGTRSIVNAVYGGRRLDKLPV
ncbi:MAG TPA: protein translocase subunit SecD [Gammaproteobacteria bacterium]|jgi:preprotein translocase subunit SecD|nr:protein translocase subunit SecD [Gammaproteobacteria bacterium]